MLGSMMIIILNLGQVLEVSAVYAKNITLTSTSPKVTLQYNNSEPSCDSVPCSCDVYVDSPQGTILKTTFLDLQIPPGNKIIFINVKNNEELLNLSSIYSVIAPIYLESSQMRITFDRCDSSPYSYIEAEFSFKDQLQDSHVRSSGGAFALSGDYPSVTIQTANLSSLTNLQALMHWFITISSAIWIKVDILEMEPGSGNRVCIFDTYDTYGEWVCMTDSVSSTTWYSYDDELRMEFNVSYPCIGFTVKLTLVEHSTWNGQTLTLPVCNPTVILQETQTIRFVTPFFNQSLENVRFQCRMNFTSRDPLQPASVEYKHFHFPGEVTVNSVESQDNLADATGTQVTILNDSPIVSISPTHEIYLDVNKYVYSGDGSGVMVQPYNFANRRLEPLESFGVAMKLNDSLSAKSFTTLGYPTLPEGDINIRWLFDKAIPGSAIKVEFVDFDIGAATLFVHEDEKDPPIRKLNRSTLPDNIYSKTQRLTLLLRSDRIPCCKRGIHFNVSVIMHFNDCTSSPCSNGGTCTEMFRCTCLAPYYGHLCQDVITTAVSTTQISTQSPNSHKITGVEVTDTSVGISGGEIIEGGMSSLTFNVALQTQSTGGNVEGTNLWQVTAFGSSNSDGTGTRYLSTSATLPATAANAGVTAGQVTSLEGLSADFMLSSSITCAQFQYLCVKVDRDATSNPVFALTGVPDSASLTACTQTKCGAHQKTTNPLPRTTASNTMPSTTQGLSSTSNSSNTMPSATQGLSSTNSYTNYIVMAVVVLLLLFVICILLGYIRRRYREHDDDADATQPGPRTESYSSSSGSSSSRSRKRNDDADVTQPGPRTESHSLSSGSSPSRSREHDDHADATQPGPRTESHSSSSGSSSSRSRKREDDAEATQPGPITESHSSSSGSSQSQSRNPPDSDPFTDANIERLCELLPDGKFYTIALKLDLRGGYNRAAKIRTGQTSENAYRTLLHEWKNATQKPRRGQIDNVLIECDLAGITEEYKMSKRSKDCMN